jgi:hypothetical protein
MTLPAKMHDAAVRLASLFPGEVGKLVGNRGSWLLATTSSGRS